MFQKLQPNTAPDSVNDFKGTKIEDNSRSGSQSVQARLLKINQRLNIKMQHPLASDASHALINVIFFKI